MPEELKSMFAHYYGNHVSAAPKSRICLKLFIDPIAPVEVYRHLGYPREAAPAPGIAKRIAQIVSETQPTLRPRGAYALYAVSNRTSHSLELNGTRISGNFGEYLDRAERVAVFVVTVGEEISHFAKSAAKNNDAFSAWVMDAVGSCAVEASAEALTTIVRSHLQDREGLTLRCSPGYCGMHINQQRKLFQLVQAGALGVTLMPSMGMHPVKSISGIVGLAPKESVRHYRSPCDRCARTECSMRRFVAEHEAGPGDLIREQYSQTPVRGRYSSQSAI